MFIPLTRISLLLPQRKTIFIPITRISLLLPLIKSTILFSNLQNLIRLLLFLLFLRGRIEIFLGAGLIMLRFIKVFILLFWINLLQKLNLVPCISVSLILRRELLFFLNLVARFFYRLYHNISLFFFFILRFLLRLSLCAFCFIGFKYKLRLIFNLLLFLLCTLIIFFNISLRLALTGLTLSFFVFFQQFGQAFAQQVLQTRFCFINISAHISLISIIIQIDMAEQKEFKNQPVDAGQVALRCAQFFMSLSETCFQFYHKYNKEKQRKTKIIKKNQKTKPKAGKRPDGQGEELNEDIKKKLPKKPLTAYIIYFQQKKPNFVQKYPGLNLSDLTKLIAKQWKEIDGNQRKPYLAQAQDDRKRYQNQMRQFKAKYGPIAGNNDLQDEEIIVAFNQNQQIINGIQNVQPELLQRQDQKFISNKKQVRDEEGIDQEKPEESLQNDNDNQNEGENQSDNEMIENGDNNENNEESNSKSQD